MIYIKKSEVADTRTCDYTKVSREQLLKASIQHIGDVAEGFRFIQEHMNVAAARHDFDKVDNIQDFHRDFLTGFRQTEWWDNHRRVNRHHLGSEDGIPENVNLVDVLEYVIDCVMAGKARRGEVFDIDIDDDLLKRAFKNTAKWLEHNVEVSD